MSQYELVSFALCPYVQRSVITLNHKHIDFDVTYIDLKSPPAWFLEISPMGKVPVLKVDGAVLFESAVINEYLDEVTGGGLLPSDALDKAQCRAWIEFASELLGNQYMSLLAKDETGVRERLDGLQKHFASLQKVVKGPYFLGKDFSLVDTAFAPFFLRHAIVERLLGEDLLSPYPRVKDWSKNMLALDEVQHSVPDKFASKFVEYFKNESSWLALRDK